ncbi:FtsQ-type POTRA domain-containing protein [Microbacterium sp. No. 7]|uniref:FtsQ-type POTRA domain-containing protein n=1 Tax=Microbacterium sp. No. 7 TaxID=1714373 RepID=UPI0006CF85F7|nr:FtsQ-type POTRA domain-containing protein [Microbacterium sp. No. 7]ALJ20805.1 hypothetical protein AOA12_13195 [Microbacterium sp. No. 7]
MRRPSPLPASTPIPAPSDEAVPLEVAPVGPPRRDERRPRDAVEELPRGTDAAPRSAGETPVVDPDEQVTEPLDVGAGGGRPEPSRAGSQAEPNDAALAPVIPLAPDHDAAKRGKPAREKARGEDAAPDDDERPPSVWAAARARRRALRAEVRRFTARRRRRRRIWIAGLGSLVVLLLATLGIVHSPLFAVETITVVGAERVDAAAVEQSLASQAGTPLARVDTGQVKAALATFPMIASYALEARPPHELVVRIVERAPVGSLATEAGHVLVDAAGVVLSTTPEPVAGFPVITVDGGTEAPAFRAVADVFLALPPEIAAGVTEIAATTPNDVSFTLGAGGPTVVWGNADRSAEKAEVLAAILRARPADTAQLYDVSTPDAIVVR